MTQQQRDYYTETAPLYESMHVQPGDEHFVALEYAAALLDVVRAKSVLDVGSGTGRAVRFLRQRRSNLQVEGVEPVSELRECLASLAWAEQVVVVDSGSTDATVRLARALGAEVVQQSDLVTIPGRWPARF